MSIDTTKKVTGISVDGSNMQFDASIDANIVAGNIKKNVSILGVTGSFEGGTLQSKTVNITRNGTTVVLPDSGYFGLQRVEINTDVQESTGEIYGVEWDNDSTTTMTRTDDATNMTYAISNGRIASDFDNVFPYNQMKRTTIDGNVFVYVPAMYFRITTDENHKITGVAVSESQGSGDGWYQTRAFYYGAYGASSDGSVLKSVTGATRVTSITRAVARQRAMAVGTGYHQRDLYAGTILMFLWWIEFATKDSQAIMTGRNNGSKTSTGGTDSFYDETEGNTFCVSGYNTSGNQMVWHGIEDFYGNTYEWEDGITGNGTAGGSQYVSDDYTKYDDYSNGSQMDLYPYASPASGNGNCLESLAWDDDHPFLVQPLTVRNDSNYTTGFCDYASTSNNVVSNRGANYYTYARSGVSYFHRNAVSSSDGNIGCRLLKNA